ncbi:MAG: chorismate mutase [Firmicutes bacterium]|nr:chorismate mutase [Bacillota bacterium]
MVRAVRGATTVEENSAEAILGATGEMLRRIMEVNRIEVGDLVSVIFSMTEDLNAVFPARAAREMGWNRIPLMCCREIEVPGSLARCIRVLIHFHTSLPPHQLAPVYLREAVRLREDLI